MNIGKFEEWHVTIESMMVSNRAIGPRTGWLHDATSDI